MSCMTKENESVLNNYAVQLWRFGFGNFQTDLFGFLRNLTWAEPSDASSMQDIHQLFFAHSCTNSL